MATSTPSAGEHVMMVTDQHWVKYVIPVTVAVFLFITVLLLFLLAGISAHHYEWLSVITYIIALILFLFTTHWFFIVLLSEALDRIIITNKRLIRTQYSLLFREDILEISFEKMKTVDAQKKGILQNIFHYGTLVFESKLASIPLVPHPNRVAKTIQAIMMSHGG